MILLGVGLILGYLLARVLSLHAGWLGRRWARRLTGDVRSAVTDVIEAEAFAPLATIEAARSRLGSAVGAARR
jgi:hypothetical protein